MPRPLRSRERAEAALLWLKETTGSDTLSGLIGGIATLPMVLLGPIAGVFMDRTNRGRLIAWTDIAGGVLVSPAAVLFFAMPANLPLLLAVVFTVSLGTGLLDTFSQPDIGASFPDLVPRDKLEAANGLNLSVRTPAGGRERRPRLAGVPALPRGAAGSAGRTGGSAGADRVTHRAVVHGTGRHGLQARNLREPAR